MSNATLYRASYEIQAAEGRTLVGFAVPWNKPNRVRDVIAGRVTDPYFEAFDPASADRSISHSARRPVFVRHDYNADPIGVVAFQRSEEGLLFEAPLSKTGRADEMLELVIDGAMRSVSVGFRPIQHRMDGDVTVRTEIALRELSLAPTGFGQYADAAVLAVRDENEEEGEGAVDDELELTIDALHRRTRRHLATLQVPYIGETVS